MFLSRRKFLGTGITALGTAVLAHFSIFGASEWSIPSHLELKVGHPFDLKTTLPKTHIFSKNKKYVFSVDQSGAELPQGIILTSDGILSIDSNVRAVTLEGVIFSYSEKA